MARLIRKPTRYGPKPAAKRHLVKATVPDPRDYYWKAFSMSNQELPRHGLFAPDVGCAVEFDEADTDWLAKWMVAKGKGYYEDGAFVPSEDNPIGKPNDDGRFVISKCSYYHNRDAAHNPATFVPWIAEMIEDLDKREAFDSRPWGRCLEHEDGDNEDCSTRKYKYQVRLICDPREEFFCGYVTHNTKSTFSYSPDADQNGWRFIVKEGRVNAIYMTPTARNQFNPNCMTIMLEKFKTFLPSLEGYVVSSDRDYWVIADKVYQHKHALNIESQARSSYQLHRDTERKRTAAAEKDDDDDDDRSDDE